MYGYGLLADQSAARRIGLEIVEAYAIAGAGTQIVKHLMGRSRPYRDEGYLLFAGPILRNSRHSFPSGDVTVAFTLSSVLAAEAKSAPVTILLYGLASMTAFQRLHRDQHWLSDVLGGAAWGTAVGLGVVHMHRKGRTRNVSLVVRPDGVGVNVGL
jgi:undecaprenyl-diphosphatase